ncbi:MAG: DinB family protein [Chloroflexota bacterium]|nr:DinB family protein [Chloroflexota bacterium]
MTQSQISAERALEIWQFMQDELVRVVGLLSNTQMNMRIAPNVRTLGEQAEHIVRGRALWVHKVVDDPSLEPMMNWDEPDDPTHSAAEVVAGLQHTWRILRAYIEPSTTDTEHAHHPGQVSEQEKDGLRTVWGMLDHDLCHAGELALMLGVLGLETPEF